MPIRRLSAQVSAEFVRFSIDCRAICDDKFPFSHTNASIDAYAVNYALIDLITGGNLPQLMLTHGD